MAAYPPTQLAPNVPATFSATGYDVNTDVIVYPPTRIAPVGSNPRAYVYGDDGTWHPVRQ